MHELAAPIMKQASCVSSNACDTVNSGKINNSPQSNAPSRRKLNKKTSKTPINNKSTIFKEDALVRVGCPYYVKDPNKYHERLACRGAGFKEVAKLRYILSILLCTLLLHVLWSGMHFIITIESYLSSLFPARSVQISLYMNAILPHKHRYFCSLYIIPQNARMKFEISKKERN